MKVLVCIGHPAHIHYFKNCAQILQDKGFEFHFAVRDKESTIDLIKTTGFNYSLIGKGGKGVIGKLAMLPVFDYRLYNIARKFKPDIFLSFASPYAAQVSKIMGKPHIALDDTEHAKYEHMMYRPFSDVILSPSCYRAKLHKRQILFDSYLELCYVHPKYFKPDETVLNRIGVMPGEKYCIVRFIAWDANHDVNAKKLSVSEKVTLIKKISQHTRVFISSEVQLPTELEQYRLLINPQDLHNVLSFATLHIGEGGTTASEAALLGTPTIHINRLGAGLFEDEQKRGILYDIHDLDSILDKSIEILSDDNSKSTHKTKLCQVLSEKIDPTAFMVWFIENYPTSKQVMIDNPDYQYNFK